MFANKAPAAQPLLNICSQTRTQLPEDGANICSAARSGGDAGNFHSLPVPAFLVLENASIRNCQKIPITSNW